MLISLRKSIILLCFLTFLCSCTNDNVKRIELSYKKDKYIDNHYVYYLKIKRISISGERLTYYGHVSVQANGKFSGNENILESSKDICTLMNYVPNDPSEDGYVKELRCDNNTSFYYLRLIDGELIIEEEDNT